MAQGCSAISGIEYGFPPIKTIALPLKHILKCSVECFAPIITYPLGANNSRKYMSCAWWFKCGGSTPWETLRIMLAANSCTVVRRITMKQIKPNKIAMTPKMITLIPPSSTISSAIKPGSIRCFKAQAKEISERINKTVANQRPFFIQRSGYSATQSA